MSKFRITRSRLTFAKILAAETSLILSSAFTIVTKPSAPNFELPSKIILTSNGAKKSTSSLSPSFKHLLSPNLSICAAENLTIL